MSSAGIAQLVQTLFPWTAGAEAGDEARLREDLGLDSLHLVELQMRVEDRFRVRFDPLDDGFIEAFETVGGLHRYVRRLRADGE